MIIVGVMLLVGAMILLGAFFIRAMRIGFDLEHIQQTALASSQSTQHVGEQLDEVGKAVDRLKDQIMRDG